MRFYPLHPLFVSKVRALYKHEGKNQQGFVLIGFAKGDVMTLVKKREDGWSRVRKDGAEGWAPTSYLEVSEGVPLNSHTLYAPVKLNAHALDLDNCRRSGDTECVDHLFALFLQ